MLEGSGGSNTIVRESQHQQPMPPTLHIGVPTISSTIGLSLPLAPPWSQNAQFSGNSSFEDRKDEVRHMHGMMPVYAENFGLRGLEVRGQGQFVHSNHVNNGPSILPVPHGYLNGQETERARGTMHVASLSRPPELHGNGFVEEYSNCAYSTPPFGHGDGLYAQGGTCHGVYLDSEELRDEQSATFAMYRFKVEKCSKQFVHDWKECPYAHEGETARRRHPLSHTAQPCPDFKNSKSCPRGNSCPMAHGPWEAGLHPDAYRTNLCAYGHECKRRMCFFAHDNSELRTIAPGGTVQQTQQSGASSSHGQSGRTDANIRGGAQVAQLGSPVDSVPIKRVSPRLNRGLSVPMRGNDPQSFLTSMVRDDFADLAGSFRQHMTLEPEREVAETGFHEETEVELHPRQPHVMVTTQSLPEYRQVFEVFDRQGHPTCPPQANGVETGDDVVFAMPSINGAVSRGRTDHLVGAMSSFSSDTDVETSIESGQVLPRDNVPSITLNSQATVGRSQSPAGLSTRFPDQVNSSESVQSETSSTIGEHSGDKHQGVRRHLQVNIPITSRTLNPPGISPTDVMLKQDTSWVDKLLDSPIEASQNFSGRRTYKFQ